MSNAKQDYLSVVGHYVNHDWEIEKRVTGLRLIDVYHSGDNIPDCVATVANEFGITDKTSLCGKIIEERRQRLTRDMVEMLTIVKDFELGQVRSQHSVEDRDLEESYNELLLDEDGHGSTSGTAVANSTTV
ncbi:hypothetical protein ACP70R_000186 [Stipagrostis hirtigluma subsp. patula]